MFGKSDNERDEYDGVGSPRRCRAWVSVELIARLARLASPATLWIRAKSQSGPFLFPGERRLRGRRPKQCPSQQGDGTTRDPLSEDLPFRPYSHPSYYENSVSSLLLDLPQDDALRGFTFDSSYAFSFRIIFERRWRLILETDRNYTEFSQFSRSSENRGIQVLEIIESSLFSRKS